MSTDCFSCGEVPYGMSLFGTYLPWSCGHKEKAPEEKEMMVVTIGNLSSDPQKVFEDAREQLQQIHYLPDVKHPITRLLYLTTFQKEHERVRSPFTESQVKVFKRAANADRLTTRWLRIGMVVGLIFATISLMTTFSFYQKWSQKNVHTSIASGVALFFIGIVGTWLSYSSTGTNPHFASNAANEWQNETNECKNDFDSLSVELIQLKKTNLPFAKAIAESIPIDVIRSIAKRDNPLNKGDLFLSLECARKFVLDKPCPFNVPAIIKLAIESQEANQKLERKITHLDRKNQQMQKSLKKLEKSLKNLAKS